jgi:hypothetical protein
MKERKVKIFKIKKVPSWTQEEDQLIIKEGCKKRKNWKKLSLKLIKKTPRDLIKRYNKIFFNNGKWTPEEDNMLLNYYESYGENWGAISRHMKVRNWKQIRERFINVLDKNLLKVPFSIDEDIKIYDYYPYLKNKWVLYKEFLPGRSVDNIKTRFYSSIKGKDLKMRLFKCL